MSEDQGRRDGWQPSGSSCLSRGSIEKDQVRQSAPLPCRRLLCCALPASSRLDGPRLSPGYFSNALCSANVAMNCRSSPMPKPQLPVMT